MWLQQQLSRWKFPQTQAPFPRAEGWLNTIEIKKWWTKSPIKQKLRWLAGCGGCRRALATSFISSHTHGWVSDARLLRLSERTVMRRETTSCICQIRVSIEAGNPDRLSCNSFLRNQDRVQPCCINYFCFVFFFMFLIVIMSDGNRIFRLVFTKSIYLFLVLTCFIHNSLPALLLSSTI